MHHGLITTVRDTLAAQVAPHYIVRIEQRAHIATPGDPGYQAIVPDVYPVRGPARGPGSAPAAISTPTLIEPLVDPEIRDHFVEVLDARNRAVVATLEILSPVNKTPGALGREQFERKRRAVMSGAVHWIEIDLLRAGERPVEVAGRSDYYALLRRGGAIPYEI